MSGQDVYEALLAEIAALSVATIKVMSFVADHTDNRDEFFKGMLEHGTAELRATMYASVPPDRYAGFLAKAQSRYAAILKAAATKV